MISFDDVAKLSTPKDGVLVRTKCFLCRANLLPEEKAIQLAQLSSSGAYAHYDVFKNKMNVKIILMHIACFRVVAGDEFLFDES